MTMLEGLPALAEHLIGVVTHGRQTGSLTLVVHHLLGDVANAAELAMTHYFPLTLNEPYLQNSSLGTPYQKWAKFTNDDFEQLDACVRRLLPAASKLQYEWDFAPPERVWTTKDAGFWFTSVHTQYASCAIDPSRPSLTLSAIHLRGWVDPGESRFQRVVSVFDRPAPPPPVVTKSERDISNRAVIAELYELGLARVEELRALQSQLADWIQSNCTLESLTAPHRGTLSWG